MIKTVTLDLTDFAAQQALKLFLVLHGRTFAEEVAVEFQPFDDLFTLTAEDRVLVAWDGLRAVVVAAAGGWALDAELDQYDLQHFYHLAGHIEGASTGLWLYAGRVHHYSYESPDGREWDTSFDGRWFRPTVQDVRAMGLELEFVEDEIRALDDDRFELLAFGTALRNQYPQYAFDATTLRSDAISPEEA